MFHLHEVSLANHAQLNEQLLVELLQRDLQFVDEIGTAFGTTSFGMVRRRVPDGADAICSELLPLEFRLLPAEPRPHIEVTNPRAGSVRKL